MDSEEEEDEEIKSLDLQDAAEMEISEESVRQVIAANGGKITNKALVKHFKKALGSSSENRTTFRNVINEIATVWTDPKGRDHILLKEVVAATECPKPSTSGAVAAPPPDAEEKENDAGTPVAEVNVAVDTAPSPSGDNVRERARLFNEMDEKAIQEREKDSPSRILRSATDERACVCASGHAEEDNTISEESAEVAPRPESSGDACRQLDDIKRKWMMISARCAYHDMARFLQDHRHLVGWKNFCNGYTALHYAAKFGEVEAIKLLAGRYKANVNAINQAGMTPLHLAAMFNRGPAIQILVETYKADPNIRDYRGKLPKDYLTDVNTRRMSLHVHGKATEQLDALNNYMYLDAKETVSDTVQRYLSGVSSGTLRHDVGTLDGAAGGTLKPADTLGGASILRRSFRVGTSRNTTMSPVDQRSVTLEDQLKKSYASSMKRGNPSSPVARTLSMPKARGKKHIKNQKKFASMVEEIPEEASE